MANGHAQDDVIAFLSEPRNYGADVRSVERHETHGAIVFLAGDRAYKLKRAVRFPYMDYSTVDLRRQMCLRELGVNQRTARQLYLEVRPIVSDGGSLRFGNEAESARAVDWVVVMQRFPQDALLKNICRSGGLTSPLMRRTAEAVACFHAEAEVTRNFGGEAGIRAVIEGNAAVLKSKRGRPFDDETVRLYEGRARELLTRIAVPLEDRREKGHVRRCHGDLHLNNIFVLNNEPVLFDAIEFNDRFACIDVLYDLAFLLMDLDQHGNRLHANTVLNRYLELTGEHAGLAVLPLFLSCRAAVRAHTTAAAAETRKEEPARRSQMGDASALLERAVNYLANPVPRLVAIGGVSGTGKSTLAYALAPLLGVAPGAVVIRSDVVRKQLLGVEETARLPESAYSPAITEQVYERVAAIASDTLVSGHTAIADAVYGKEIEREAIVETARRRGTPFTGLWLEGPPALLEKRIAGRRGDASDATADVLRAQLGFVAPPQTWNFIDAATSADQTLAQARKILDC